MNPAGVRESLTGSVSAVPTAPQRGLSPLRSPVRKTLTKKQHFADGRGPLWVAISGLWDTTRTDLRVTDTALHPNWLKTNFCQRLTAISAECQRLLRNPQSAALPVCP